VPGLSGAPSGAGLLVAGGSVGGGVVGLVVAPGWVACGAGVVVVGRGRGVFDVLGVGLAEGEWLVVVEKYVVATYGVGDGLWWRTCLCTGLSTVGVVVCGEDVPARAIVPISTPARDPPTALTPATVSERPRAAPP